MFLASRLRALGLFAAAVASTMAGCATTTTTTTYTPITGILIRSASLVAGRGCGTLDSQVYRYAAAVYFAPPDAGAGAPDGEAGGHDAARATADAEAGAPGAEAGASDAEAGAPSAEAGALEAGIGAPFGPPVEQGRALLTNIFDCYTDGVFENLPSSDAGSLTFTVTVFAYNKTLYDTAGLPPDPGCPPMQDASFCSPTSQPLTPTQQSLAPWTTLCTATQQAGTPVIAICAPLQGQAASSGSGPDASPDAQAAASDASTDAPADATMTTAPPASVQDAAAPPDADAAPADAGVSSNDG